MPIRQEEFPYDVGPTDQLTAELKLKLLKLGLVVHGFPAKTKRRYFITVAAVRFARCARAVSLMHSLRRLICDGSVRFARPRISCSISLKR